MHRFWLTIWTATLCTVTHLAADSACWAIDISGVQSAALDQPRINVLVRRTPNGAPLTAETEFGSFFNIEAFYDTGASGILLSTDTADQLGITRPTYNGQPVVFEDVGVAGSDQFQVSETLHFALPPFQPEADIGNPSTYASVYNQTFGPVRTQIGPSNAQPDPFLQGLDVFGMPAMAGKVVVMDPKPVETLLDLMRTYVYEPGTPFHPATTETDPGIPATNVHVKLSYASFDRFTRITPSDAPGPSLRNNPFIGPNPVAQLDPNPPVDPPPISIALDGEVSTGSFLLDTGAATSIISKGQATNVHVRYVSGTEGTDDPQLESFDPADPDLPGILLADQFQLTVGGIGGTTKAAGFYLDSLLVPTMEADPNNPSDPRNLRFISAPVLVADITVQDPDTDQTLTLDGILGMNYMVTSALLSEGFPPIIDNITPGAFDWIVFDEPSGILGLQLPGAVPEPSSLVLLVFGNVALVILFIYRRGRRPNLTRFQTQPYWETSA